MKRFAYILTAAATAGLLSTSVASAGVISSDIITAASSSGDNWQAFPGSLNSSSPTRPYWDQKSEDGTDVNIGNYLDGGFTTSITGPNHVGVTPTITPTWWGGSGGAFDSNVHFNQVGSAPITVSVALKATSLTGTIGLC